MIKVYLDDERLPPVGWVRAKTSQTAINLLSLGIVEEISLDHDLGDEEICGNGYKVLLWIEEQIMTNESYNPPIIKIHTANVSARQKMISALDFILRQRGTK
jgi:hypothetical protein